MPRRSAVYIGHSPFLVLGIGLACPDTSGDDPRVDRDEQHQCGHDPNCDALHAFLAPE